MQINSVKVKTNHLYDVPHFIYEGLLTNPNRIEEDLINDPMNGKSTLCCTSFNVINGIVGQVLAISLQFISKIFASNNWYVSYCYCYIFYDDITN